MDVIVKVETQDDAKLFYSTHFSKPHDFTCDNDAVNGLKVVVKEM